MDFFEAISKRHSYRGTFENRNVPKEDIVKILDAGLRAPSGYNSQTTRFVVVTDATIREKLNEILPSESIATAPVNIIVISKHLVIDELAFEFEDYSAAVENILLAVTAMGYATVWTAGDTMSEGRPEKIAALIGGISSDETVRAILPVGIPTEPGVQAEKQAFDKRVTFLNA